MIWSSSKAETESGERVTLPWSHSHISDIQRFVLYSAKYQLKGTSLFWSKRTQSSYIFLYIHLQNHPVQQNKKRKEMLRCEQVKIQQGESKAKSPQTTGTLLSHQSCKNKQALQFVYKEPHGHPGCQVSFLLMPSGTSISGGLPGFYPLFAHYHRGMKGHGRIINTFSKCHQSIGTCSLFSNWWYSEHYMQITLSKKNKNFHGSVTTSKTPCNYDYFITSNF